MLAVVLLTPMSNYGSLVPYQYIYIFIFIVIYFFYLNKTPSSHLTVFPPSMQDLEAAEFFCGVESVTGGFRQGAQWCSIYRTDSNLMQVKLHGRE